MTAPDDVQLTGIGAPQAHWLGLMDHDVAVSATPGDPEPVLVRVGVSHRRLNRDEARAFAADVLAAVDWQPETID